MPAYFCIRFICEKKNMYPDLVKDFCESLLTGGFAFLSGYWGSEEEPFAQIAAWNQKKLTENFEPGPEDRFSDGYRQMLFSYGDYSEVRMYILNAQEDEEFSFDVIVPEDELIDWNAGAPGYRADRIADLIRICRRIWLLPYVSMI